MKERINVSIEKGTIDRFDDITVDVSRSAYINKLMDAEIERKKTDEVLDNTLPDTNNIPADDQELMDKINTGRDILRTLNHFLYQLERHYPNESDRVREFKNVIDRNHKFHIVRCSSINNEITSIKHRLED